MCNKFRSFGLRKFHEKGCENMKCAYFHPNACRDSMKNRTCPRNDCRFYHLKGTKNTSDSESNLRSTQGQFASKNRFENLSENETSSTKNQVFHQALPSDAITLTDIMKELMAIKARQDLQEKYQNNPNSDNSNWRHPSSQPRSTQSQQRAWDSQRRNQSQRSQRSQF